MQFGVISRCTALKSDTSQSRIQDLWHGTGTEIIIYIYIYYINVCAYMVQFIELPFF